MNSNVSAIASIAEVRRLLVAKQRTYARDHDLVMEGRDIGTAVFPRYALQVLHRCLSEVRARRRAQQGLARLHRASVIKIDSTARRLSADHRRRRARHR